MAALPFPKHFDGKRFFNPDAPRAPGFPDVLKWKLTSRPEHSSPFVHDVQQSKPPARVNGPDLRVTLINHSSVLLQQNGINILADPVWSERASPFSWIGPKRHRAPGVRLEDMPEIDVVLLSHNHYDHLDLRTLRWLNERGNPSFVVPLGLAKLLRSRNIQFVNELDWGESAHVGKTIVNAVPALHFSGRRLTDRNKTLWCGYVVQSPAGPIYFAGDTAFGNHFSQIQARFGSPAVAFLPIGAYKPRWFMAPVHMAPDEAVRACEILQPRTAIAIHHGTFQLADDALDTAAHELSSLPHSAVVQILRNGESLAIPAEPA